MEDGQTVKNRKRVESGNQKYGESRKHRSSAFRIHSSVSTSFLLPRLGSARLGSLVAVVAVAAAIGIKKTCPRWWPQGAPHELRCSMTRTFPTCHFGMGRTCGPLWRGRSSPPCTAMLFARTGICAYTTLFRSCLGWDGHGFWWGETALHS